MKTARQQRHEIEALNADIRRLRAALDARERLQRLLHDECAECHAMLVEAEAREAFRRRAG